MVRLPRETSRTLFLACRSWAKERTTRYTQAFLLLQFWVCFDPLFLLCSAVSTGRWVFVGCFQDTYILATAIALNIWSMQFNRDADVSSVTAAWWWVPFLFDFGFLLSGCLTCWALGLARDRFEGHLCKTSKNPQWHLSAVLCGM